MNRACKTIFLLRLSISSLFSTCVAAGFTQVQRLAVSLSASVRLMTSFGEDQLDLRARSASSDSTSLRLITILRRLPACDFFAFSKIGLHEHKDNKTYLSFLSACYLTCRGEVRSLPVFYGEQSRVMVCSSLSKLQACPSLTAAAGPWTRPCVTRDRESLSAGHKQR